MRINDMEDTILVPLTFILFLLGRRDMDFGFKKTIYCLLKDCPVKGSQIKRCGRKICRLGKPIRVKVKNL